MLNEEYKEKAIKLGREVEKFRLEVFQNANKENDIEFFNHVNDLLFRIQSDLSYSVADGVELLDYKK